MEVESPVILKTSAKSQRSPLVLVHSIFQPVLPSLPYSCEGISALCVTTVLLWRCKGLRIVCCLQRPRAAEAEAARGEEAGTVRKTVFLDIGKRFIFPGSR